MRLSHYSDKQLHQLIKAEKINIQFANRNRKTNILTSLSSSFFVGLNVGLFVLDAIGLSLSYFPANESTDKDIEKIRVITGVVIGTLTLIAVVPVSIYYFRKSYAKYQERERKIQLAEFKLPLYEELIKRKLACLPEDTDLKPCKIATPKLKPIRYNKLRMKAFKTSIASAASLFGTYVFLSYYGFSFVGLAGVAAVLTGPTGIGIAIGVTLLVAGILTLCRYHQLKQQEEQQHKLQKLNSKVDKLDNRLQQIKQHKNQLKENLNPIIKTEKIKKSKQDVFFKESNLNAVDEDDDNDTLVVARSLSRTRSY